MSDINPFLFGKTVSETFFTNREYETSALLSNIKASVNTIIVSPRRYGKTSLVKNLAYVNTDKKIIFVFIDMYNIRTEDEFYNTFSSKIIDATNSSIDDKIQIVKKFLSNFNPQFGLDAGDGNTFKVSLSMPESTTQVKDILDLPEKISQEKNIKIVICLDEFQNIEYFAEPLAFQKSCRSYWQNHKIATYILFGSKQHMLTELFQSRNAPFYRFGDIVYLKKIDTIYLSKYIIDRFAFTNKEITEDVAVEIISLVKNHPYYAQQLSYILWYITGYKATNELLTKAKNTLLDQNTILYQSDIENISNTQINFLRAVINGERKINSRESLNKYKLNSTANVARVKKALVKKEILEIFKTQISFYDPIFELWLKERYFI